MLNFKDDAIVLNARDFAIRWHGKQKYGKHPYSYHLDGVVEKVEDILIEYNIKYRIDLELLLLFICAYLHDVLEDTSTTINEITLRFGRDVALILSELTNKSNFYSDYIFGIRRIYGLIIKLADLRFNMVKTKEDICIKLNKRAIQRLDKYKLAEYIIKNRIAEHLRRKPCRELWQ